MDTFREEASQRELERLKRQQEAKGITVIGLATPDMQAGAGQSAGESFWQIYFKLSPWKTLDGDYQNSILSVSRTVSKKEIDQIRQLIESFNVVEMQVSLEEGPEPKSGILTDLNIRRVSNSYLESVAEKLREPVQVEDELFGTLTYDRRYAWYFAKAKWGETPIDMMLHTTENESLSECLKQARHLWSDQQSWNTRIQDFAVAELFDPEEEYGIDDVEGQISPEQFKQAMSLLSISIYPDGNFEFCHDDGELFGGHWIVISGSLDEGPTNADTPG